MHAVTLTVSISIVYFLAARLSLALLTKPDGIAVFWPAAGVSAGALIALGFGARWPIIFGTMAATILANLLGDRNVWSAVLFALCNAGEALRYGVGGQSLLWSRLQVKQAAKHGGSCRCSRHWGGFVWRGWYHHDHDVPQLNCTGLDCLATLVCIRRTGNNYCRPIADRTRFGHTRPATAERISGRHFDRRGRCAREYINDFPAVGSSSEYWTGRRPVRAAVVARSALPTGFCCGSGPHG